jgi:hypothetical protein
LIDTRLAGVLVAVIAASTLASCGDSVLDSADHRPGHTREGVRGDSVGKDDKQHDKAEPAKSRKDTNTSNDERSGGSDGRQGADGKGADQPGTQTGSKPAESCTDDVAGDMDGAGNMPTYADFTRGCVREQGDQIALTAVMSGPLPSRMPDANQNFAVAFELEPPTGRSIYVQAEATADGWSATVNQGGNSRTIGGPTINCDQLVLRIPAEQLGGAQRVTWSVDSSWLKSTLTSTEYAFDDAPNGSTMTLDRD